MRFEKALENRGDRSLAIFWNELFDDLFENEYIKELEWTNFSLMMAHAAFITKVKNNMKCITMGKRAIKQAKKLEYASKNT